MSPAPAAQIALARRAFASGRQGAALRASPLSALLDPGDTAASQLASQLAAPALAKDALSLALFRGLETALAAAEAGDTRALASLASIAKAYRELTGPGDAAPAEPPRFIVELAATTCPPQPQLPPPPPGASSPPPDGPATP